MGYIDLSDPKEITTTTYANKGIAINHNITVQIDCVHKQQIVPLHVEAIL